MNLSPQDYYHANVYQACNDEYRAMASLNTTKVIESPYHTVRQRENGELDVVIDKKAPDIDDIFLSKGTAIAADEILDRIKRTDIRIPIRARNEFREGSKLPLSDLLSALHYYTSDKVTQAFRYNFMTQTMDETALLAFGMLVEHWIEEEVTESAMRVFLENDDAINNPFQWAPDETDESGSEDRSEDDSEDGSEDGIEGRNATRRSSSESLSESSSEDSDSSSDSTSESD